jgi:hypothetical protein
MNPLDEEVGSAGRSARVFGTIVQWTIAAINAKGYSKIDPNKVILDKDTLRRVGKVVCVYSTKPIVQGAAALLELLARLLLLIIFLALSCTPKHRSVIVERVRMRLESSVNSVRGCVQSILANPPASRPPPPAERRLDAAALIRMVDAAASPACFFYVLLLPQVGHAHGPRRPGRGALWQVAPPWRCAGADRRGGRRRQEQSSLRLAATGQKGAAPSPSNSSNNPPPPWRSGFPPS